MFQCDPDIRVTRDDVNALPICVDDDRGWNVKPNRAWVLVCLEEDEVDRAWQTGRRAWVDVPEAVPFADLQRDDVRRVYEVALITKEQAELAERAYLWKQATRAAR